MKVRAKFHCQSVEHFQSGPTPTQRYVWSDGKNTLEPDGKYTWPRTFRFVAQYDPDLPEDQRYAQATPSGELRISVDNPNVIFEPGKSYYLDFVPVEPQKKE